MVKMRRKIYFYDLYEIKKLKFIPLETYVEVME